MAVMGLAARPGRGVPAVHDDSTDAADRPGFREGAADRSRRPAVAVGVDRGISVVVEGARVESQAPGRRIDWEGPNTHMKGDSMR